mgnify:CR=1 FL=1
MRRGGAREVLQNLQHRADPAERCLSSDSKICLVIRARVSFVLDLAAVLPRHDRSIDECRLGVTVRCRFVAGREYRLYRSKRFAEYVGITSEKFATTLAAVAALE